MKKRLLAILMTAVLTVGSCIPVLADEIVVEDSVVETEETLVDDEIYEEDGEAVIEDEVAVEDEAVIEDEADEIIDDELVEEEEVADIATDEIADEDCATAIVKSFSPNPDRFHEDVSAMSAEVESVCANMTADSPAPSAAYLRKIILNKGYNELKSDYNAIKVATDNEMTILQYATEADTVKAYNAYVKAYGKDKVFYDHVVFLADDDQTEYLDVDSEEIADENAGSEQLDYSTSDTPEYFAKVMGANTFKAGMTSAAKGKKIIVADLDTGLNTTHEKIKGKYVSGHSYFYGSYKDDRGHGTQTASCILGVTKGTQVKVMPIKVFPSSGGTDSATILAGMKWAISHGANILNMSLGGQHDPGCTCYNSVINDAYNKGITIVVSSGNEYGNIEGYYYTTHPASYRKCITVGATDKSNVRCSFSNYGAALDVVSYGEDIYMPTYWSDTAYTWNSGTSFSCPLTTGAVALLYASGVAKTPAACEKLLKSKAKDLGAKGRDDYYGSGTVRIGAITPVNKEGWGGKSITLKVTNTKSGYFNNPKKVSVTYKSSNTKVATVNKSGKITAKASGTATITAKTKNGTYKLTVKVVKPGISGSSSVKKGKTTTYTMKYGSGTTKWYSTNPKIASVSSKGVVKGVKKGTATIVAINNNIAYMKKITVK